MRVLHVIPGIAHRYGGPSHAVRAMCRASRVVGVESCIATTDADGTGRLAVPYNHVLAEADGDIIYFPRQWSEAFKVSLPLGRWLAAHVGEFDLVEVHAIFSHSSVAAGRACRRQGVPYIVRPLGSLAPWSLAQKAWRKRLFWQLAGKRMVQGAAALHFTSEAERRQAERVLRHRRAVVVPLPVELTTPDLEPPAWARRPYVLALGRLHPKKGLDVLIDAFAAATVSAAEWQLVIAGDGEPTHVDHLRAVAARCGVVDRVAFPGWIEGREKELLLSAAALLALPSRQENFGLAAVEALAAGVPIVLSSEADLAQDLEAAGAAWVAAPQRQAFAAALAVACFDEGERRSRGQLGREYVRQHYSAAAVGERLLAFYRSLTDISHPPVG